MIALIAVLPFISTLLGGLAALRLRHRLHPVMAVAAGVLVATALVDLLPEAIELTGGESSLVTVGAAAVIGFLVFSAIEALVHRQSYEHSHPEHVDPNAPHEHGTEIDHPAGPFGLVGPLGLIVHSTLDGLAIGLGFEASTEVGVIVTLAVLGHDFADGLNVVTLALAGGRSRRGALTLLGLDALAPVFGVLISTQLALPPEQLGVLLAVFSGVFIAIGAGHLLPEAQHQRPGSAPHLVALAAVGAVLVIAIRSALA